MTRRRKVTPVTKTPRKKRASASTTPRKQQSRPSYGEDGPICLAISLIDSLLDKIRSNRIKKFEDANIGTISSLGSGELKILNSQYKTTYDGMKEALAGDSFQLEAYSNFTNVQMNLAVEYFKALRAVKHDDASGKIRQTVHRKLKEKSPEEITKKVLHLDRDAETGVEGLGPAVLVGAKMMWVYNTKTRRLGCYYAKNDSGLTAKGTTVLNYDEEHSTFKTLRKPKEQLWKFMSNGLKFWDAIRSTPQKMPPRLNRETMILKVA